MKEGRDDWKEHSISILCPDRSEACGCTAGHEYQVGSRFNSFVTTGQKGMWIEQPGEEEIAESVGRIITIAIYVNVTLCECDERILPLPPRPLNALQSTSIPLHHPLPRTHPQIGIQFLPIVLWCSNISIRPLSKSMFRGSDGKCKCLPAIVIEDVAVVVVPRVLPLLLLLVVLVPKDSPPNPSALPLNMLFVVVIVSLSLFTRDEDVVPLPPSVPVVVVNSPSAVISHEEMMREARMYSWPAPTLTHGMG